MAQTVAELQAIITADSSGFDAAMGAASGKLNEVAGAAGNAGKSIQKTGEVLTTTGKIGMAAGAAMLAPIVGAVKSAATMEQAMDRVGVAFGITEGKSAEMDAQFREMEDTINEVAKSTIFGADDISEAAIEMGKAGVDFETMWGDVGDSSDGAIQGVADFAAATATELPQAAKIAATMANQWGMSSEEVTASLDDLTTVFNTTSLGSDDFIKGMANVAPMMKLAGADFDETAATLGFFKDQGLSAAEAGTSLTAMLRAAVKPTGTQQAAMDELGITTADFFDINEQGVEELRDFPDILDMINEKTKDLSTSQRLNALASLFGLEAFDAAGLGILSDTDKLRDLNEEMKNNTGIAREQSDALTDNLLGSIEELGGAVDVLQQKMGDPFLGPIKAGVDALTGIADAASGADPALLGFAGKLATLSGGLLAAGGLAAYGTGQVLKLGKTFADAGLSLGKFAAGIGLAGLAIGAGLLAYETNFLGFRDTVDKAMAKAGEALDTFGETFDTNFNAGKSQGMNDLAAGINAVGKSLKAAFGIDVVDQMSNIAKGVDAFGDAWQENIAGGVDPIVSFFDALAKGADAAGMGETADQMDRLSKAADAMQQSMAASEGKMPQLNREALALREGIGSLTGQDEELTTFFDDLGMQASLAQKDIQDFTDTLASGNIGDAMGQLIEGQPNYEKFFGSLGAGLRDGTNGLGDFKDALTSGDWEGAAKGFEGGIDAIGQKFEEVDLGGKLQGVSDQVGDWFGEIGETLFGGEELSGTGRTFKTSGILDDLATGMVSGLQDLGPNVLEKLGDIGNPLEGVTSQIGDWFGDVGDTLFGADTLSGTGRTIRTPGALDDLATGMVSGLKDLGPNVLEKLGDIGNPLEGVTSQIGDWFGDVGDTLFGSDSLSGTGRTIRTPGVLDDLATGMVSGLKDLGPAVLDQLGDIGNPLEGVTTQIGDWFGDVGDTLFGSDTLSGTGRTIRTPGVLDDLASGMVSGLKELGPSVLEKLGDIGNPLEGVTGQIGDWFGDVGDTLFGSDSLSGTGRTIRTPGVLDDLANGMVSGLKDLGPTVLDKLGDIGNPLEGVTSQIGDWFGDVGDTLFGSDSLSGTGRTIRTPGVLDELATGMVSGLKELGPTVVDKLGDIGNPLEEVTTQIGDWFGDVGDTLFGSDALSGTGRTIRTPGVLDDLANGMVSGLKDLGPTVVDKLGEIGNPLEGVTSQIGDWFGDVGDTLFGSESLSGTGRTIKTPGVLDDLATGMVSGLKELGPSVLEQLGSVGNPFEEVGTWFGGQWEDMTKSLFGGGGQEGYTGPGADLSGGAVSEDMFGMIGGFVDNMATGLQGMGEAAATKIGEMDNPFVAVKDKLGEWLGPIGSALFGGGEDPATGEAAKMLGDPAEMGAKLGTEIADTFASPEFATGIENSLKTMEEGKFDAVGKSLLGMLSSGMTTALDQPVTEGDSAGQTMGQKMVEGLANGLTNSITNAPAELFTPVAGALGTQLGTALQTIAGQQVSDEGVASLPTVGGINLVKGLATGLTASVAAAPPELFAPVAGALGTQLGAAMSMAEKVTQAPGGVGPAGPAVTPLGNTMVQGLATGLATGIAAADPAMFIPVSNALGTQLGAAMSLASQQTAAPGPTGVPTTVPGAGVGMVQGLATGLTESITAAPPEMFVPVSNALGMQLGAAMSLASQQTAAPGPTGVPTSVPGAGVGMVQGLATGLTESIIAAPPEMFIPVSNALGTQLGAAMSMAAQQTAAPGPTGVPTGVPGAGVGMVQGLATGLTESITAAPPELFLPVGAALGTQLGTALNTAMTETATQGQTGQVSSDAAGGIGTQLVSNLATGLTDSITNAPAEVFTPVGSAIGTKLSEALTTAVGEGDGSGATDVGAQLGGSVGEMLLSGVQEANWDTVGTGLSTKLSETLQTVADGGGESDVSTQLGDSIGTMLQTGVEGADFSGVGEAVGTQLTTELDTAIQEVATKIEESMTKITEAVTNAVEEMGSAISDATADVESAVTDMSSAITDAVADVETAVADMASAVADAAADMATAANDAVTAAEEVGTAAADAATAVEEAMQAMIAAVSAAAGAIAAAAAGIIASLQGIAAAAGAAGAAIGAALAGGFSNAIEEGSPSKVFIRFGESIVQGLAIGMTGGQSSVEKSSNTLAGMTMDSMANAIGMGSPAQKFVPHGAAVTGGFAQGMMDSAKSRLGEAMGKISGAVSSAMGKVKSSMQSAMARVKGEAASGGTAAGAAAATATAEGMESEDKQLERAARRMWKKALKELLKGEGEMRFLGEAFAREFWLGMLDASGSMEFAQFVTDQAVKAAENAIERIRALIAGLGTQIEIVGKSISNLEGDIKSLESELAGIDAQIAGAASAAAAKAQQEADQARIDAAQALLDIQVAITKELEAQLKTEFDAAHQANIKQVQGGGEAGLKADFDTKLAKAQATYVAKIASQAKEQELIASLKAIQAAIAAESAMRAAAAEAMAAAELQAKRAAVAADLEAKKAALAQEKAMQADLLKQQHAAQVAFTQIVIEESTKRIAQIEKELKKHANPEKTAQLKAELELERQKIDLANQLALALEKQANAQSPEQLAQATAQVQYLNAAIAGLQEVDVNALLTEIAEKLGKAATAMSTAATEMGKAAKALGEVPAAPMEETTQAISETGKAATGTSTKMNDMGAKYQEVMTKMSADSQAFNDKFAAMVEQTKGTAATGGTAIGTALGQGITAKMGQDAPAMQQQMLQGVQQGMTQTEQAANVGGSKIANAFGQEMRTGLGVQLPQIHQSILDGMNKSVDGATKIATQGGKATATGFGDAAVNRIKTGPEIPQFQTAMGKGVGDAVKDSTQIASQGGKDIGSAMGDGMKQGVMEKSKGIADSAAQMVKDAINAAKGAAKANSPSQKMMEVGDDMGLGLIYGLRGRKREASEASEDLVYIPSTRLTPDGGGGVGGRAGDRGATNNTTTITVYADVRDGRQLVETLENYRRQTQMAASRGS